jgi:hypothetical protein
VPADGFLAAFFKGGQVEDGAPSGPAPRPETRAAEPVRG